VVPAIEEVRMVATEGLRPVERRVLRWAETGMDDAEIGRRFGRGERWTAQVRFLADLERPRSPAADGARDDPLRPLERRLLRWREQGVDHDELSARFRRSPGFLARVEEYAQYKLAAAS
jgi:DNA-binding CsgD family transcriptional regulator